MKHNAGVEWLFLVALDCEYRTARGAMTCLGEDNLPRLYAVGRFARRPAALVRLGLGPARAAEGTRWALAHFHPRRVYHLGVAGGLQPGLAPGSLVVGAELVAGNGPTIRAATDFLPRGATVGRIATVESPVFAPEAKASFHERTGAVAVDMESHAVASACAAAGVPLEVIRAIADPVDHPLRPEFFKIMSPDGVMPMAPALALLARRPSLVAAAIASRRQTQVACSALSRSLLELSRRETSACETRAADA